MPLTPRALVPVVVAAGCVASDPGTIVGNPGESRLTAADASGATYDNAFLAVEEVTWTDCQQRSLSTPVDGTIDLLDPVILAAPPGSWCQVDVVTAAPLDVLATGEGGGALDVVLDLQTVAIDVSAGLDIAGGAYVVELGAPGWIDAAALGVGPDSDVVVRPGDADHDALVAAAIDGAAVYADGDADGQISASERQAGPVGAPPDDEDDGDGGDDGDDGT